MSGHTPGPWTAHHGWQSDDPEQDAKSLAEHPDWIEVVSEWSDNYKRMCVSGHAGIANARLIAAAPELLEACQTIAEWLRREEAGGANQSWYEKRDTPEGEQLWREWYDENLRLCALAQIQARAAIAKATQP